MLSGNSRGLVFRQERYSKTTLPVRSLGRVLFPTIEPKTTETMPSVPPSDPNSTLEVPVGELISVTKTKVLSITRTTQLLTSVSIKRCTMEFTSWWGKPSRCPTLHLHWRHHLTDHKLNAPSLGKKVKKTTQLQPHGENKTQNATLQKSSRMKEALQG
jgi:hypothetical protein